MSKSVVENVDSVSYECVSNEIENILSGNETKIDNLYNNLINPNIASKITPKVKNFL